MSKRGEPLEYTEELVSNPSDDPPEQALKVVRGSVSSETFERWTTFKESHPTIEQGHALEMALILLLSCPVSSLRQTYRVVLDSRAASVFKGGEPGKSAPTE